MSEAPETQGKPNNGPEITITSEEIAAMRASGPWWEWRLHTDEELEEILRKEKMGKIKQETRVLKEPTKQEIKETGEEEKIKDTAVTASVTDKSSPFDGLLSDPAVTGMQQGPELRQEPLKQLVARAEEVRLREQRRLEIENAIWEQRKRDNAKEYREMLLGRALEEYMGGKIKPSELSKEERIAFEEDVLRAAQKRHAVQIILNVATLSLGPLLAILSKKADFVLLSGIGFMFNWACFSLKELGRYRLTDDDAKTLLKTQKELDQIKMAASTP